MGSKKKSKKAERLQRLEDREEIRALVYAYGYHLDAHEFAEYAALFTEDGEWRNHYKHCHNRAEIQAMVTELMSDRPAGSGVHVLTSPVITFESADVAKTKLLWSYVVANADADGAEINRMGRYEDTVVRCADGKWRIKARFAGRSVPALDTNA